MKKETQKSVTDWCRKHYPNIDKKHSVQDLLEEVIELAAATNLLSLKEINKIVQISYNKSEKGIVKDIPLEIADTEICLYSLASMFDVNVQQSLNSKMKINRKKSVKESQKRYDKKERFFNSDCSTLQNFLIAAKKFNKKHNKNKATATKILQETGLLTKSGRLSSNYYSKAEIARDDRKRKKLKK